MVRARRAGHSGLRASLGTIWSAYVWEGGPRVRGEFSKITKSQQHPRASRAVPHPSTDRAFSGLSSEFEWDREFSTEYGRWREGRVVDKPRPPDKGAPLGFPCNLVPLGSPCRGWLLSGGLGLVVCVPFRFPCRILPLGDPCRGSGGSHYQRRTLVVVPPGPSRRCCRSAGTASA